MTAIQTLCAIIAQRGTASETTFRDQVGFDRLIASGLVQSGGFVQSICCEACDEPHDAPVVYEDGNYGHYCDQSGFVKLAQHQLVTVQPDIGKLVAHLAAAFGCKRRKTSTIQNETWRVGAVETQEGDLVIFFQPTMQDHNDIQHFKTALSHEIGSQFTLLLTANGIPATANAKTVMLDNIISLSDDGNGFALIANPCEIVGVPKKSQGGQFSPYT